MRHPAFANLGTDGDGNPRVWRNEYSCYSCTSERIDWSDEWSCECDSECPNCDADCSPVGSDWLPTCTKWDNGTPDDDAYHLWASLPEGEGQGWGASVMPLESEPKALTTITAIVSEVSSPKPPISPWPLIYVLQVLDIKDDDAILRQIADIRYDEICDMDEEQDDRILKEIIEGLALHFVFAGDLTPVADWRE